MDSKTGETVKVQRQNKDIIRYIEAGGKEIAAGRDTWMKGGV